MNKEYVRGARYSVATIKRVFGDEYECLRESLWDALCMSIFDKSTYLYADKPVFWWAVERVKQRFIDNWLAKNSPQDECLDCLLAEHIWNEKVEAIFREGV